MLAYNKTWRNWTTWTYSSCCQPSRTKTQGRKEKAKEKPNAKEKEDWGQTTRQRRNKRRLKISRWINNSTMKERADGVSDFIKCAQYPFANSFVTDTRLSAATWLHRSLPEAAATSGHFYWVDFHWLQTLLVYGHKQHRIVSKYNTRYLLIHNTFLSDYNRTQHWTA